MFKLCHLARPSCRSSTDRLHCGAAAAQLFAARDGGSKREADGAAAEGDVLLAAERVGRRAFVAAPPRRAFCGARPGRRAAASRAPARRRRARRPPRRARPAPSAPPPRAAAQPVDLALQRVAARARVASADCTPRRAARAATSVRHVSSATPPPRSVRPTARTPGAATAFATRARRAGGGATRARASARRRPERRRTTVFRRRPRAAAPPASAARTRRAPPLRRLRHAAAIEASPRSQPAGSRPGLDVVARRQHGGRILRLSEPCGCAFAVRKSRPRRSSRWRRSS